MIKMPDVTKNIYFTIINYNIDMIAGTTTFKFRPYVEEQFPSDREQNWPCDLFIIKYWAHK